MPGGRWMIDALVTLALLVPVLVASGLPSQARMSVTELQILAVPVVVVAVLVSRRLPTVAAATPAVVSVVVAGSLYTDHLAFTGMLLACLLGRRTAGRRAVASLAACLGVIALARLTWPGSDTEDWFELGSTALFLVVLPWTVGQFVRRQEQLIRAGWNLARQLEHEQDRVAEQVRLRERTRIAADMHDSLGHEISLIAVRAAALQVDPRTGEEGRRAAGELRQSAADATERLRAIIGMLREDGDTAPVSPAGDPVADLVRRAETSGMDVRLHGSMVRPGADPPLVEATARAAYRVVQEGLTNAAKHALGSPVRVCLRQRQDHLVVTVTNALVTTTEQEPGGYGLVGLDERVRLLGGRLEAGPEGGEFVLRAYLPLQASMVPSPPSRASRSRHAEADARRALRRGLVDTLWPAVVIVVLLAVLYLAGRGWG